MSTTIDEKVLEMRFNNRQFEKGAAQSMRTLDKLKESLKLDGTVKDLNQAFDSFSLDSIANGVDKVAERFSNLGMIGASVLHNITNRAVDTGIRLVKSLSVDNISAGQRKYEMKTSAVQTIIAATRQEGETLEEAMTRVEPHLDRLLKYTDETSYDFATMVNNIGKFTSNGIGLEDAEQAMEGIANWAAISGVGINEATRAFYNSSQAIASGSMKMVDWKSFELLNMSTAEFKQTVMDTAVEMGTLEKKGDKYYTKAKKGAKSIEVTTETFNTTLSKGWFSSDVFMNVLKNYGNTATDLGKRAYKAAQEAKTFTDAIQAVKDAVSTQWMQTFEYIFGNYAEAKEFFTNLANELTEVFTAADSARNEILKLWHDNGGREAFINSIRNLWEIFKGISATVTNAVKSMLPVLTSDKLIEWTKALEQWTQTLGFNLGIFDEAGNVISTVTDEIAEGMDEVTTSAENAADAVESVSKAVDEAAAKKLYSSLPKEIQKLIDSGEKIDYKRTSTWRNRDKYYDYLEASTGKDYSSERAMSKAYGEFGDYQKRALAQIEAGTLKKEEVDTSRWTKAHIKAWEEYWAAVGDGGEKATDKASDGLKKTTRVAKQFTDEAGNVITYFEDVEESANGAADAVSGVTKEIDELKAKQLYNELPKEIRQLIDSGVEIDFKRTSNWRNLDKYYDYLEASTGKDYSSDRAKAKAYGGFGDVQKRALARIEAGEISKDDVDTSKWTAAHLKAWNEYWDAFEKGEAAMAESAETASETVQESTESAGKTAKEPIKWMAKFERIAKGFGAAINIVRKVVQEIVSGVTKVVSKLAPIAEVFVDIFADIGDMIVSFDQKYDSSGIKGFFDTIAAWIEPVAKKIADWIRGIWESIKNGGLTKILDRIKEIWEKVKTFLKPVTTPIVEWFKKLIGKVKDPIWQNFMKLKWKNKIDRAVITLRNVWNSVSGWLSTTYQKVKTWADPILKKIGEFFTNLWNSIIGWFNGGMSIDIDFSGIGSFFQNAAKKVGDFFKTIWEAITGLFSSKETKNEEKKAEKEEKKEKSGSGLLGSIGAFFTRLFTSINNFFTALKETGEGIINGINSVVDFVVSIYDRIKPMLFGLAEIITTFRTMSIAKTIADGFAKVKKMEAEAKLQEAKKKNSFLVKLGELLLDLGKSLLMIAGAIAIVAGVMYLVSKIPHEVLYSGLKRLAAIIAMLIGTVFAIVVLLKLTTKGDIDKIGKAVASIGTGFLNIAITLLLLVPTVFLFGVMPDAMFKKGFTRIIEILAILTVVIIAITKLAGNAITIATAGILLLTVAGTLVVLLIAVSTIAGMEPERLAGAIDALLKLTLVILAVAAICAMLGPVAGPAIIGAAALSAILIVLAAGISVAGNILSSGFMTMAAKLAVAGKNLAIFSKSMAEITNGNDIKETLEALFSAMRSAPSAEELKRFDQFTNKLRAFGTTYVNFVGRMNTEGSADAIQHLNDMTDAVTGLAVEGLADKVAIFAEGMRQLGAAVHLYAIGAAYGSEASSEAETTAIDFSTLPSAQGVSAVVAFLGHIAEGIPDDLQKKLENVPDSSNMGVFAINLTSLGDAVTAFLGSGIRTLTKDDETKIDNFFRAFGKLMGNLTYFNSADEMGTTPLSRFAGNVEELGGALEAFGTNLNKEGISAGITAGIANLESFAALNETLNPEGPFFSVIGRLIDLGTRYTLGDLVVDITNLGGALGAFGDIVTADGYDQTKVDQGIAAISSMAAIQIPKQGNFIEKILDITDTKKFGEGIGSIGTGLSKWDGVTAIPSDAQIKAIEALTGISIPAEESTLLEKIMGLNDTELFAKGIGAMATGLSKWDGIKALPSDEQITALTSLSGLSYPDGESTLLERIMGLTDTELFAKGIGAMANGMSKWKGIKAAPTSDQISAISSLAGMTFVDQGGIWNAVFGTGDQNQFAGNLGKIGEGFSKFVENAGDKTISETQISAIERLGKLEVSEQGGFFNAVLGTGNQQQFAGNLGALGTGINNFVTNVDGKEISESNLSSIERLAVATKLLQEADPWALANMLEGFEYLNTEQVNSNLETAGTTAATAFGTAFAAYFAEGAEGANDIKLTPVIDNTNIDAWKAANGWLFGVDTITLDPSDAVSKAQVAGHNIEITVDNSDAYDDTEMRTLVSTLDGHIVSMNNLLKNQKIYLNTGLMVGALAPGIDKYLGRRVGR